MPQLLIVADDLTGAADTGACFARAGLGTVVRLSGTTVPEADVVAVSTESRDLDDSAATKTVHAALIGITGSQSDAGPRWVYKSNATQYALDYPPLFVRWQGLAGGGLNGERRAEFRRVLKKSGSDNPGRVALFGTGVPRGQAVNGRARVR